MLLGKRYWYFYSRCSFERGILSTTYIILQNLGVKLASGLCLLNSYYSPQGLWPWLTNMCFDSELQSAGLRQVFDRWWLWWTMTASMQKGPDEASLMFCVQGFYRPSGEQIGVFLSGLQSTRLQEASSFTSCRLLLLRQEPGMCHVDHGFLCRAAHRQFDPTATVWSFTSNWCFRNKSPLLKY